MRKLIRKKTCTSHHKTQATWPLNFSRPKSALSAILWSGGVWTSLVLSSYFIYPAFGVDVGLLAGCLLTTALAISVSIPQAPGFLGVFQLAVTLVLVKIFGVDEAVAKAAAIVLWTVQLLLMSGLGFVSLAIEGVALSEVRGAKSTPPSDDG